MDVAVVRTRGLSSTLQDDGRKVGMGTGLPPGGAADLFAYELNNIVLGNRPGSVALEMMLYGGSIEFLVEATIAATGADMRFRLDDRLIRHATPISAAKGSILETQMAQRGCFAYIGVAGGLQGAKVLESESTYAGGRLGGSRGPLVQGDRLVRKHVVAPFECVSAEDVNSYLCAPPDHLRIIRGPQDDYFSPKGYSTFTTATYRISNRSNRMAYRLEGPAPEVAGLPRTADTGSGPTDCIEEGIPPGGIEIAGGQEVICFGRDGPTSGAYAKIGCIIGSDMSRMAQLRPGDSCSFREVDIQAARAVACEYAAVLAAVAGRGAAPLSVQAAATEGEC